MQYTFAEVEQRARDALTAAGLVIRGGLNTSGELVTCGTTQKPNGTDGRYKLHMDFPPTIGIINYHEGGEWRNVPLYTESELADMSESERNAFRERIRAKKEESERRLSQERANAAHTAKSILADLPPASSGNAYLVKKGVPALGELRQVKDGRLALPVISASGEVVSLQYIDGDGNKRFLKGGQKKGCFFPIPARSGKNDGPLLIAEGYATAASLHLATGYACLVAFDAGNLSPVAEMARSKYPSREIIVCADNDCETERGGKPYNPGKEKAEEAARKAGCKIVLCPDIAGHKADFNDVHSAYEDGLEKIRAVIELARIEENGCIVPDGFKLILSGPDAGLYKIEKKKGSSYPVRLGPPLIVQGYTRDTDGKSWGLFLKWKDPDGVTHTHAMPRAQLSLDGWDWHASLVDNGWLGDPNHKRKVAEYLAAVKPSARYRCVPRVGWYEKAFVLPDETIGDTGTETVVLQTGKNALGYRCGGDLEAWKKVAALCAGNSRLMLSLCASFAGPLLKLAGMESGGFNLVGGSSTGKSTAQRLAASVWDGPDFIRSWRTSDNGLEGVAALHNDCALILDELGQAPPKTIEAAAYMLGSGQGKSRADRNGFAREAQKWNVFLLSSGELGLAAKLAEIGLKPRPGQEVRLVDIDAEAGAGMGIVEQLHGFRDSGELIRHIQEATREHYGHAGRAFLNYVAWNAKELEGRIREGVREIVDRICPENADGQVRRVAMRFALCILAGRIAMECGALPWEESALVDSGIEACFKDWLKDRGTVGPSEDAAILREVRELIERDGAARFQYTSEPDAICRDRVGFKRNTRDGTEYLFPATSFKTTFSGHSPKRIGEVLRRAAWLRVVEQGRNTCKVELPGLGRVRCYVVRIPDEE